ncbi:MAG: response regulator, partial [Rubrobacteraceae bacterium]
MKKRRKEGAVGSARVIVADDHRLLRAGIAHILASAPGFEVVGEAKDGSEAVALCEKMRPDLALMDVQMPGMDGLEATREIKARWPRTCIVMVTAHDDPEYVYEALKAGAAGYVLKHASPEEMVSDTRKALAGESLLPRPSPPG